MNRFILKMHRFWIKFSKILIRKFNKIFLLKLSYDNPCVKFEEFSRQNGLFIFPPSRSDPKVLFNDNFFFLKGLILDSSGLHKILPDFS